MYGLRGSASVRSFLTLEKGLCWEGAVGMVGSKEGGDVPQIGLPTGSLKGKEMLSGWIADRQACICTISGSLLPFLGPACNLSLSREGLVCGFSVNSLHMFCSAPVRCSFFFFPLFPKRRPFLSTCPCVLPGSAQH